MPPDPALQQQAKQAETDKVEALTQSVSGETAKILMRYGTTIAMSGASIGSPLSNLTVAKAKGSV